MAIKSRPFSNFVKAKGQNSNTFLEDLKRINALMALLMNGFLSNK